MEGFSTIWRIRRTAACTGEFGSILNGVFGVETAVYRIRYINIHGSYTDEVEICALQKAAIVSQLKGYCPIHEEQLTISPYENEEKDFCPKCEAEWMGQWQTELAIKIHRTLDT